MRFSPMLLIFLLLSGCFNPDIIRQDIQVGASSVLGCPVERVQAPVPVFGDPRFQTGFRAAGCDREATCSLAGYTMETRHMVCEETPDSVARTEQKVVVDRLVLETGCPPTQVQVVERANWSRGGEAAFRMWACGNFYACTTAPGRTECKPVMAPVAPAQQVP